MSRKLGFLSPFVYKANHSFYLQCLNLRFEFVHVLYKSIKALMKNSTANRHANLLFGKTWKICFQASEHSFGFRIIGDRNLPDTRRKMTRLLFYWRDKTLSFRMSEGASMSHGLRFCLPWSAALLRCPRN